jgi:hypothetical protein
MDRGLPKATPMANYNYMFLFMKVVFEFHRRSVARGRESAPFDAAPGGGTQLPPLALTIVPWMPFLTTGFLIAWVLKSTPMDFHHCEVVLKPQPTRICIIFLCHDKLQVATVASVAI